MKLYLLVCLLGVMHAQSMSRRQLALLTRGPAGGSVSTARTAAPAEVVLDVRDGRSSSTSSEGETSSTGHTSSSTVLISGAGGDHIFEEDRSESEHALAQMQAQLDGDGESQLSAAQQRRLDALAVLAQQPVQVDCANKSTKQMVDARLLALGGREAELNRALGLLQVDESEESDGVATRGGVFMDDDEVKGRIALSLAQNNDVSLKMLLELHRINREREQLMMAKQSHRMAITGFVTSFGCDMVSKGIGIAGAAAGVLSLYLHLYSQAGGPTP